MSAYAETNKVMEAFFTKERLSELFDFMIFVQAGFYASAQLPVTATVIATARDRPS